MPGFTLKDVDPESNQTSIMSSSLTYPLFLYLFGKSSSAVFSYHILVPNFSTKEITWSKISSLKIGFLSLS